MKRRSRLSNAGRDGQNRGHERQPATEPTWPTRTGIIDLLPRWRRMPLRRVLVEHPRR
jgi:hypothetical protein